MIIDLDIQSPVCGPSGLACVEAVMAGRVPEEECLERCEGTITEVEKLHSARSEGDWGLVLEYYEKYKYPHSQNITLPYVMKKGEHCLVGNKVSITQ